MSVASETQAAAELLSDNIDARLIAVLDFNTERDLLNDKPHETETLKNIGVSATNADRFIRPWINDTFRKPNMWSKLERGGLTVGTTYSKLRDLCTKK